MTDRRIETRPRWRAVKPSIVQTAEEFQGKTAVDRMAIVMMIAWGHGDPENNVSRYPTTYVATFADMARDVLANLGYIAPEVADAAVEAALDAWFHETLQGAHDQLRADVLDHARDRMRGALNAARAVRS